MDKGKVFLAGCHKSGSSLLRSLFYTHEEAVVVPIETHLCKMLGFYTINSYHSSTPSAKTIEHFKQNVYAHVKNYLASSSKLSDARILKGSFEGFKSNFQSDKFDDFNRLGHEYFKACIKEFTTQRVSNKSITIEKSVTNSEFAIELSKIYPEARFIHIVRNPYANLVALRKYNTSSQNGPFLLRLVELLRNDYYFLYKNKYLLQDRYKIIKYEDLLNNPESEMNSIAAFLGIRYNKSLLKPQNALGDTWRGNSTTRQSYDEINQNKINEYKDMIHPLEVKLINKHFNFILNDFSYDQLEISGSVFRPFPKESLKRYIINRITNKLVKHWSNQ